MNIKDQLDLMNILARNPDMRDEIIKINMQSLVDSTDRKQAEELADKILTVVKDTTANLATVNIAVVMVVDLLCEVAPQRDLHREVLTKLINRLGCDLLPKKEDK